MTFPTLYFNLGGQCSLEAKTACHALVCLSKSVLAKVGSCAYLTESVDKVVSQKSIPAQIRQLSLYMSNNKGPVDGVVRELTFAKRLYKHFL